ncbi:MAG: hypothetical protein V3W31_00525, partial [Thermodesulfobacteriota bacterium]
EDGIVVRGGSGEEFVALYDSKKQRPRVSKAAPVRKRTPAPPPATEGTRRPPLQPPFRGQQGAVPALEDMPGGGDIPPDLGP